MDQLSKKEFRYYANFLKRLANDMTKFYNLKLNRPFKVINKSRGKGYDPVTKADRVFEKFIRSRIQKKFPKHNIIGEEFGHKKSKSDYLWVIDPIDGTRSFVIGNPTCSNLVSLNYKGNPVVGLANFPILKKFYFNISDKTAYVSQNGRKKRLKVNIKATFSNMKMSAGFHGGLTLNKQKKIPQILKRMQFPCADALSYSHFAEGKLDVVIQYGNKIWDIHALIPIIRAAGGLVTTWENDDAKKAGNIICSANKSLHNKMLKILKPVSK